MQETGLEESLLRMIKGKTTKIIQDRKDKGLGGQVFLFYHFYDSFNSVVNQFEKKGVGVVRGDFSGHNASNAEDHRRPAWRLWL